MKLFIKDHISLCILYLINMFFLFYVYEWVGGLKDSKLYFMFLSFFLLLCYLIYHYFSHRKFYERLSKTPVSLEESLGSIGNSPLSEGLNQLLKGQYSLYQNQIQEYVKNKNEHLTFINQWVHQMKTPLAVIRLIIQENEEEEYMDDIKEEIERLDRGLNMALYMARLDGFQHDFHVGSAALHALTLDVVNDLKTLFIRKHVYPQIHIEPSISVQSDEKWLKFILQQLLNNGIRYSDGENKKMVIAAYKSEKDIVMEVKDQGIGIPKSDIRRVFEPFYTGENGRKFGESTGMGLYLVKKVCERLDHNIELESEEGVGTTFRIIFQNANNLTQM